MASSARLLSDERQALLLATKFLTGIGLDWAWVPGAIEAEIPWHEPGCPD